MIGITELISRVGDTNIILQNLNESLLDVNVIKKEGRIRFATSPDKATQIMKEIMTGQKSEFIGLILWLPRDKVQEITKPTNRAVSGDDVTTPPNPISPQQVTPITGEGKI